MNKEFEALKRIRHIHDMECGKDESINKDFDIIEEALKDYEMEHTLRIRLENINYELVREKQENEKKLKALEIIKEDTGMSLFETNEDNSLGETHYYISIGNACAYLIQKEKYDLLKEVFTNANH